VDTKKTKNKQFLYDVMVLHVLNKNLIEQSNWHYCQKFTLAILRLRFQLFNFNQDKTYYLMFIVVVFELYSWQWVTVLLSTGVDSNE
jgi:hypothetical protein